MSRRSGKKFHASSPGKRHGRHGDTSNSKSNTKGATNTNTGTGR